MAEIDLATKTLQLAIKSDTESILDGLAVYHIPNSGPGSEYVIEGNKINGFLGEVPADLLITGDALASQLGLTAGTAFNSDAGWLKVLYMGKVLFVAKRPFRYNLSWDRINAVDGVYGNRTIDIGSNTYRVRLMKGGENDTGSAKEGAYGRNEWNTIMYSLISCARVGHLGAKVGQLWNSYTNDQLGIGGESNPDGSYTWCQETDPNDSSQRVCRGSSSVSGFVSYSSYAVGSVFGWRPVLELVQN